MNAPEVPAPGNPTPSACCATRLLSSARAWLLVFPAYYDEDEAQRIAEARVVTAQEPMAEPIEVEAGQTLALPPAAQFEILLQDMGITGERRQLVEQYISLCENSFNTDRENVISQFLKREEDFRAICV